MSSTSADDKRIIRVVAVCFCVFVCAFAAGIRIDDDACIVFRPNSFQALLVLFLSIVLFRRLIVVKRKPPSLIIVCIAVLFGAFTVLGMQLDAASHTLVLKGIVAGSVTISSPIACALVMTITFIGFALLYYAVIDLVYEKLARVAVPVVSSNTALFGRRITYPLCALILLIAWLPYLIYFFPGMPSSDTSRHMAQFFEINGLSLDTHFPYLVGLLFSGLYKFGCLFDPSGYAGIFLMMLPQLVLGVFAFSSVVVWLGRLRMGRKLVVGSLLFFAFFPLVPIYMLIIEKDTLHAELLLLFTLQVILLFRARQHDIERSHFFGPVALGVVAILIALTRNNGIVLVFVGLAVVAILAKDKRIWASLGCVLGVFCLWQFVFVPQMGVASEGPREALSMPAQVAVSYVADDLPLDEADEAILRDSYERDLADVAAGYDPLLADGAKRPLALDSTDQLFDYLGTVGRIAIKDPAHAASAALATTYGVWYPYCYGTYYAEDCPYVNSPTSVWASPQWFASWEDLPSLTARAAIGSKLLHGLHHVPGFSLLYAPGFYLWAIIFILGFSLHVKRARRQTIAVLAPFFTLALVLIFGPCSSLRYAIPFVFALPLFVTLLLYCLQNQASGESADSLLLEREVVEK